MSKFFSVSCVAAALALSVGAANTFAHEDALLLIDPEGNLVTGGYDFDDLEVTSTDIRVYEAEFDGFGFTDEPGFNSVSSGMPAGYSALPADTDISFDAPAFSDGTSTANLWHWDGAGAVNFAPVSSPTALTVSTGPSVDLDGSSSDVTGFVFTTTSGTGFSHQHLNFNLASGSDGFYLWSFEMTVGSLTSEPIYFVHGFGTHTEVQHEAAVDWVTATFIPEPSTAVLAMAGVGLLLARRRKTA